MPDLSRNEAAGPRMPSIRAIVAVGVCIQVVWIVLAAVLYAANRERAALPLLVEEVLVPEDMVYGDSEVAPKRGVQLPPVDVAQVSVATEAQVAEGGRLYVGHCAACHGAQGRGDGPAGIALDPLPRDLTVLEDWGAGARLSDVFRTVTVGLEDTQMPGFDYLTVAERFAVSHYVTSLVPERPSDTAASLESLDSEFNLSGGSQEPNVVPLSTAMEKLVADDAPPVETDDRAAAEEPAGAEVFARLTLPGARGRVDRLLQADTSWRTDHEGLRTLVISGAPWNGFSVGVALMSDEEWAAMARYLTLRYGQ